MSDERQRLVLGANAVRWFEFEADDLPATSVTFGNEGTPVAARR